MERLKIGRVVGIFPECGIRAGASSVLAGAPVWVGFAGLSVKSDKPVVPCVVAGTDRLYQPKNWLPAAYQYGWGSVNQLTLGSIFRENRLKAILVDLERSLIALKDELVERFRLLPK